MKLLNVSLCFVVTAALFVGCSKGSGKESVFKGSVYNKEAGPGEHDMLKAAKFSMRAFKQKTSNIPHSDIAKKIKAKKVHSVKKFGCKEHLSNNDLFECDIEVKIATQDLVKSRRRKKPKFNYAKQRDITYFVKNNNGWKIINEAEVGLLIKKEIKKTD
ncbi:MAG: hypothetical protein D6B27_01095 [Gammaproteobacteria bacterium]|nr:MAG: hypothetical protein D6B27_01095 [Gammaproteobacteria bacterium]